MSIDSFEDSRERVRDAIDIVDLASSYFQLRREGRGYKALCPWHDDSRPSLQINAERQSFKCWVCDIGGDIFSFVMKMEGVDFAEALRMLADRAGISLTPSRSTSGTAPHDAKRSLYQVMAWVEKQYHEYLLQSPEAEAARHYLDQRGITEENIERFYIGFAPDQWDWIQQRAAQTDFSPRLLETVGVVGKANSGKTYDRFKGRVLFPIRDSQSRPIGLGGRILPSLARPDSAKYINSPETPLFSKSKQLYGLDLAREAIRKTGSVLVMEGYTDCIVAHQYGFQHAVAVLGTALGVGHIHLLKRFGDSVRIVSVLDGDEAGRRRANEVLELFVANNADLQILTLPDNADPCDFLLDHGGAAFQHLLDNTVDALSHAENVATTGLDIDRDPHHAAQALDQILSIISKAPKLSASTTSESRLREDMILGRIARRFRLPEENLRQRLAQLRTSPQPRFAQASAVQSAPEQAPPQTRTSSKLDPWECELIEMLLLHPSATLEFAQVIEPGEFTSQPCKEIFSRCIELASQGILPDFHRLLLEFSQPELQSLLVRCDELGRTKVEASSKKSDFDTEASVKYLIEGFRRRKEDQQRKITISTLKEQPSDGDDLIRRLIEQERNRQGISVPMDG